MSKETRIFLNSFDAWVRKTELSYDQAMRAVVIDIFKNIVLKTPVDTGRARANWQPTINSPSESILASTDKSGGKAIGQISSVANSGNVNSAYFLSNNLDYIDDLEQGTSKQAPVGMVRVTLTGFEAALAKAVRGNKI